MGAIDFNQLASDGQYVYEISSDMWLMDDRRLAFLVWTRFAIERGIGKFPLK